MRRFRSPGLVGLVSLLIAAAALAAPAGESLRPGDSRPWAKGVPLAEQQKAEELFEQANALLKDSVFVGAVAKYREVLQHWDHPAVHYNMVLALMNLDQPIEVYHQLEAAMRYGPAPLGDDKFQQAKAYKTLVEKELARVDVRCDVAGAKVVMDGRPLFTAPGHYEALVRAGPHTIVATREGYLTRETSPQLAPGQITTVDMKLYNENDLTQYKRRWASWIPWSVVGAGAAVALSGGLLQLGAKSDFRSFDQAITSCGGCVPTADVQAQSNQAHTLRTLGIVGYAAGGAAILGGAALLYLNRAQAYRVDPTQLQDEKQVTVVPVVAPGAGGLLANVRF